MDYTALYDIRAAQNHAFFAGIGILALRLALVAAQLSLGPIRAKINETLFNALRPIGLSFAVVAVVVMGMEYFDRADALATADALDAGKTTVYEGVVSGYEAPHQAAESTRAGWSFGSFSLGQHWFKVEHGSPDNIAGLGHGFPIDARLPDGGRAGFGMVEAGVSAAAHIARFWGLY